MATKAALKDVIKTSASSEIKEPEAQTVTHKKQSKKYDAHDLILVRSITQGTLLLPGKKSGILYRWESYGDVTEVEYQDLYTLKASRSSYLYKPFFVIEDQELLEDPIWKDLKKIYEDSFDTGDINTIINFPLSDFENTLNKLPEGYRDAVKYEVSKRIDEGTFDSLHKVRVLDRICGTDLMSTIK